MMGDFLSAFPDLVYTFAQFIAKDDFVVERYTATGTHNGQFGDIYRLLVAWRLGLASTSFALSAGELRKFGRRSMQLPARSSSPAQYRLKDVRASCPRIRMSLSMARDGGLGHVRAGVARPDPACLQHM